MSEILEDYKRECIEEYIIDCYLKRKRTSWSIRKELNLSKEQFKELVKKYTEED